ncbi:MAG: nuclear transport factor 2 family protein [Saprospiraceae bacterium]|nr:nuclear transport factor 2 family protein [Saprospiraceae bacterium]
MVAKDTVWLRQNLDDDLIYLHSNGLRETKEQHLHSIGYSEIVYQSIDLLPGTQVRQYGKIALTNGKIHVKGLLNGSLFEINLLYSTVYRRQKGKWRLLNWQSTRVQ